MKRILIAVTVAALAAGAAPVLTQGTGDDRAAQVLAAARKAIGGGKLDSLKTFSARAKVQRNVGQFQMNADVEVFLDMPDKYLRSEASSGGPVNIASTSGFNGEQSLARTAGPGGGGGSGMVIRMGPGGPMTPTEKLTPEQEEQMRKASLRNARQELSRLMLGWFASAHPSVAAEYSYVADAEAPDGRADVIEVKNADGFVARLFIDQQTHLPLMVTYRAPQRMMVTRGGPRAASAPPPPAAGAHGGGHPVAAATPPSAESDPTRQPPPMVDYSLFFGDWREVDGVKFPHSIRRAVAGTTEEEWTVEKVKVNPKIDPKKFDVQS